MSYYLYFVYPRYVLVLVLTTSTYLGPLEKEGPAIITVWVAVATRTLATRRPDDARDAIPIRGLVVGVKA